VNRYNCTVSNVGKQQTLNFTVFDFSQGSICKEVVSGYDMQNAFHINGMCIEIRAVFVCFLLDSFGNMCHYLPSLYAGGAAGGYVSLSTPGRSPGETQSYANNVIVYQYMT